LIQQVLLILAAIAYVFFADIAKVSLATDKLARATKFRKFVCLAAIDNSLGATSSVNNDF